MVKNILTLSMVASLALFSVGCGGGGSDSNDNNNNNNQQQVDQTAPVITTASPIDAVEETNTTVNLTANEANVTFSIETPDTNNTPNYFSLATTTLTFQAPAYDPNGGNEYNVTVKAADAANNVGQKVLTFNVVEKTYEATVTPVPVGNKDLTRNADGTVTGPAGLLWTDNTDGDKTPRTYDAAKAYCEGLGEGWRMPQSSELINLIDFTKGDHNNANLLEDEFTNTLTDPATTVSWAETINGHNMMVNYIAGAGSLGDGVDHAVKCVKGEKAPAHTFVTENNITTDQATQLKWTSVGDPTDGNVRHAIDGDDAANYCANLAVDGGGWRLPNINELRSLINNNEVPAAIAPSGTTVIWSATEFTNAAANVPQNYVIDLTGDVVYVRSEQTDQTLFVTCVKEAN